MPPPLVLDPRDIIIGADCTLYYNGQLIISATAWALYKTTETQNMYPGGSRQRVTYAVGYEWTLELTKSLLRVSTDVDLLKQIADADVQEGADTPLFNFMGIVKSGAYRRTYDINYCMPTGRMDFVNMREGQRVEGGLTFAVNQYPNIR